MNHSISVVIPTHNYGHYIREAIESVLAQSLAPAEIIVIDDGSTDETARTVAEFGERVLYLKQEKGGVSSARNLGVNKSTGDYIAFLDADDTWEPTKLEKQLAKFSADPDVGLVHCGMREFDAASGHTIKMHMTGGEGWVAREIALWEDEIVVGPGGTIMVRRHVFEDVGNFDTRLKNGEDWEFCFRVAMKYKIGFVPEPLVNYRVHGVNAHLNVPEMERSTLLAWEKVFAVEEESIRNVRSRSYGNLHKVLAGSYLQSREYGGFVRNLVKSLWYRPSYFLFYLTAPFRRRERAEIK